MEAKPGDQLYVLRSFLVFSALRSQGDFSGHVVIDSALVAPFPQLGDFLFERHPHEPQL